MKKSLKDLFSILLTNIEKSLGINPPKVTVLLYHSISEDDTLIDVKQKNFKSQLKYLRSNFDFITLDQVIDYINGSFIPKRASVALTFDDGYEDIIKNVVPLLKKHSIPATFFVVADPDNINRSELQNNKQILSLADCSLINKGLFTVGSHTLTHVDLKACSPNKALNEMQQSRQILEKRFGHINYFAYPKGFYSDPVANVAGSIYKASFTTKPGVIGANTDLSLINRVGVDRTISDNIFPSLFTYWFILYFQIKPRVFSLLEKLAFIPGSRAASVNLNR